MKMKMNENVTRKYYIEIKNHLQNLFAYKH